MSIKQMTAADVAKKVVNQEELFILDVRNEDAYNDWKIEGKQIKSLNKPYFDLLDGVDSIVDQLPKNEPILVVCAKEGSSTFVAEQLVEAGFENTMSLKDGMKSWSEHLEPVKVGDLSTGGSLYQFVRLGKGCLSYFIESDNEAIIIDPVRTVDPFIEFAKEKGLTIKHVIDTHLHADHVSGARSIKEVTNATYWLPAQDAAEVVYDFEDLTEDSQITLGNGDLKLEVIYSPGHTIGSTSINLDKKYLLTGDILFVHSIGRPDLAGKAGDWADDLRNTLYKKYREMSNELVVLPAHFSKISELNSDGSIHETLGKLFEVNDGLQITDEKEFRAIVSENLPDQPNSFQKIRQTNMGKINPDLDEQQEMEIGPNRCSVNLK